LNLFLKVCLKVFTERNRTEYFQIRHDEVENWKDLCRKYEDDNQIDTGIICELVFDYLKSHHYPDMVLFPDKNIPEKLSFPSYVPVQLFLAASQRSSKYRYELLNDKNTLRDLVFSYDRHRHLRSNPHIDAQLLLKERSLHQPTSSRLSSRSSTKDSIFGESLIPAFIRQAVPILIYQSKGADTGGTLALSLLHQTFAALGYRSLLCDESNEGDGRCAHPTGSLDCVQ
jgi:hypothetical protein